MRGFVLLKFHHSINNIFIIYETEVTIMAKKTKRIHNERIVVMTSLEATLATKERFNPRTCFTGAHKTDKHPSRARNKIMLQKALSY